MISQKSTLCNLLMLVCNAQFPIWHLDHHLMTTTTAQYGMWNSSDVTVAILEGHLSKKEIGTYYVFVWNKNTMCLFIAQNIWCLRTISTSISHQPLRRKWLSQLIVLVQAASHKLGFMGHYKGRLDLSQISSEDVESVSVPEKRATLYLLCTILF